MSFPDLRENYQNVSAKMHAAEDKAGRVRGSVQLVAVGKKHPSSAIRKLAELGHSTFAENFVQEAIRKQRELSDLEIEWHFIGSIQSNKTKDLANYFSWVHSVDRFKIARRLNLQRPQSLEPLNICIQVNLQGELTKSGVRQADLFPLLDQIHALPRIVVRGLMIIPEPVDDLTEQRAVFAQLRQLQEQANAQGYSMDTLSMGMTHDMESAILEGATHVRIGTALFGPRPTT